jgi:hypothetical protein
MNKQGYFAIWKDEETGKQYATVFYTREAVHYVYQPPRLIAIVAWKIRPEVIEANKLYYLTGYGKPDVLTHELGTKTKLPGLYP